MVAEVRGDYPNESAALRAVAQKLGIGSAETLRNWVKRDEVDSGKRPGTTTEESAQIKAMKKEIAELKRANDILKAAAVRSMGRCNIPGRTVAGGVAGWRGSGVRGCRTSRSMKYGGDGGTGSR
ncbi:transposase [Streptomyces sp. NBC_01563]|uniref:transposase n=1 Tax=Streptomyces sp. NBC_01563 TaxID=2975880 RepID=UPI0038646130